MTDNNPVNKNEQFPKDDSGINNDHILDLCDFIIDSAWNKYVGNSDYTKEGSSGSPSIQELQALSGTIQNVWLLVQDILDIDHKIRQLGSGDGSEDQDPGEDGAEPDVDVE